MKICWNPKGKALESERSRGVLKGFQWMGEVGRSGSLRTAPGPDLGQLRGPLALSLAGTGLIGFAMKDPKSNRT